MIDALPVALCAPCVDAEHISAVRLAEELSRHPHPVLVVGVTISAKELSSISGDEAVRKIVAVFDALTSLDRVPPPIPIRHIPDNAVLIDSSRTDRRRGNNGDMPYYMGNKNPFRLPVVKNNQKFPGRQGRRGK